MARAKKANQNGNGANLSRGIARVAKRAPSADDLKQTASSFDSSLARIRAFRDDRDWKQFHNAKDMAAAIAIEAAELQELFLWKNTAEVDAVTRDRRSDLEDEIADIAIFLLELADNLGIDLDKAIISKLTKNVAKYPIAMSKGSSKKYTEFHTRGKSPK